MAQRYQERLYTVEEYLALEEERLEKHEYFQGRIYQMSFSSPEHSAIISNTSAALSVELKEKPYLVYSSSIRLLVEVSGLFTYADVPVVSGIPGYTQIGQDKMLTNPSLLVEVIESSTEGYDRGDKFTLYKGLSSFQDYLLVDSREVYVQHYRKLDDNTWLEKTYDSREQVIPLENLGISIAIEDIYAHIEFEPTQPWHENEPTGLNPDNEREL